MKKYSIIFLSSLAFSFSSCGNHYPQPYTVTFDGNGGVLVSGSAIQTIAKPSDIKEPVFKKDGFQFMSWDKDLSTVTFTTTVTAIWENLYNITINNSDPSKGTVSGGGQFITNSVVTLTATPINDNKFVGWYLNEQKVSSELQYQITVTNHDENYTAIWAKTSTVVVCNDNWGTATGGGSYFPGETVTLKATPNDGCSFVGWYNSESCLSTELSYSFTIPDDDCVVFALFSKDGQIFKYINLDDSLSVDYCETTNTSVEIPQYDVSNNHIYKVTAIADSAFYRPNLTGIETVVLPDSIVSIGSYAFYNRPSLQTINIPNSVISIGEYAFTDCIALKSIAIPSRVTSIGYSALAGCSSLELITVDPANVTFDSRNNCNALIQTKTNALLAGCNNSVIPQGIVLIDDFAFSDCKSLESINIPNSVTIISTCAFFDCTSLKAINIPDSVTTIGSGAFYGCHSLTSIVIPKNVSYIGYYVFADCPKLESITVDADNETYDSRDNCNAIIEKETDSLIIGCMKTIIPDGVTSIGTYAFTYCPGLTEINIPSSVSSIGYFVFADCPKLESITVDGNNKTYDSRDNCNAIIEKETNSLIIGCMKTIIPDGVESIGTGAFYNCSGLKKMELSSSVTSIDIYAFYGCSSLESITLTDNVKRIGYDAFYECKSLTYNEKDNLKYLGSATSNNDYFALISFSKQKEEYTINSGCNIIAESAFYNCTNLTNIIIPNSVTSIGSFAFEDCNKLESVDLSNVTKVVNGGEKMFIDCNHLQSIKVPSNLLNDYKAAPGWSTYKDKIVSAQ